MARRLVLQATIALTLLGGLAACVNPTAPSAHAMSRSAMSRGAAKSAGGGVIIGDD
jgi:hypothetical protein